MSNRIEINIIEKNNKEVLEIISSRKLSPTIIREINYIKDFSNDFQVRYEVDILPYSCFVMACFIMRYSSIIKVEQETINRIKKEIIGLPYPSADISGNYIQLSMPAIRSYQRLAFTLRATKMMFNKCNIPFYRLYEVYRTIKHFNHPYLPNLKINENIEKLVNDKLFKDNEDFEDLFKIKTEDLFTIKYNNRIKPEGFEKLKYDTAAEILLTRPLRYEDRKNVYKYSIAPYGIPIFYKCLVLSVSTKYNTSLSLKVSDIYDSDKVIDVDFFGSAWLVDKFQKGDIVYIKGSKTRKGINGLSIYTEEEVEAMPVIPIYRQSPKNNIKSDVIINCVEELLYRCDGKNICNYISTDKSMWEYLEDLHFPKNENEYKEAIDNLAYIELFFMQMKFLERVKNNATKKGIAKRPINKDDNAYKIAVDNLPYKLTNAQKNAINNICSKLRSSQAEEILLSGDVGSGKSTVAQVACLYNCDSGYQSVLAAPTNILATQLYNTFMKIIDTLPADKRPNIAFLGSNTNNDEKKKIISEAKSGKLNILVGTHSVFNIEYNKLGLVVIDEQQKFGRSQREKLIKQNENGEIPDLLCQTATPIPQSTALAFYGDINLIPLNEKPIGRKENITKWVKQSTEDFLMDILGETWQQIFEEINKGNQIFVVVPAVEKSEKIASVKEVYSIFQNNFGKNIKIDNIHGKLKQEEQDEAIEKFKNGETQILIASSIVEVGVDIPNATVMLVLDADRFGASSLHQIRGRVGRSSKQGYCFLISNSETKNAEKRLNSLVNSNNGFDIALVDLDTRQEGDLFGERQSGESSLTFCSLTSHVGLVDKARAEAERIFNSEYKDRALKDANTFTFRGNQD